MKLQKKRACFENALPEKFRCWGHLTHDCPAVSSVRVFPDIPIRGTFLSSSHWLKLVDMKEQLQLAQI